MTFAEQTILNCIRNSGDKPITRPELMWITHRCDRNIREIIRKLRHKDHWIISSSSHPGYRITSDPREWDVFVDTWNTSNRFNMLKKSAKNENQLQIERTFAYVD